MILPSQPTRHNKEVQRGEVFRRIDTGASLPRNRPQGVSPRSESPVAGWSLLTSGRAVGTLAVVIRFPVYAAHLPHIASRNHRLPMDRPLRGKDFQIEKAVKQRTRKGETMKRNMISFCTFAAVTLFSSGLAAAENASATVPKGDLSAHGFEGSKIYPGTKRTYTLYVPKQYDPAKPACVYVSQDGVLYNAPAVFDQLIHEKAMPVTVGVFVTPGNAAGRNNRSFEYDAMTDDYVRFLSDELLPYVAKTHKLNLSTDGNDRAIAGISSGGICSFTAAWERPDAFRRVFSNVGSFGAHRGGYVYPILVRKVEPKPIRVFLQDGSNDLKFTYGDWWLANQEMEQALTFAGYEVAHSWDHGGHEATYATKIFPEVMRWLWKDWPKPIKAGAGSPNLQQIVLPGESWKPVAGRYRDATSPTANAKGEVFFCDAPANKIYKIGLSGDVRDFRHGLPPCRWFGVWPERTALCNRRRSNSVLRRRRQGRRGRQGHPRPSPCRRLQRQCLCDQP